MTRAFYRNGKWLVLGSLRNEQGQVDLGRFAAMGSEVRSPIGLKAHPFTPTSSLRPTPTPTPPRARPLRADLPLTLTLTRPSSNPNPNQTFLSPKP